MVIPTVSNVTMSTIIGQMGMTGMPWCDFFVKFDNDYHLEHIHFDAEMWEIGLGDFSAFID